MSVSVQDKEIRSICHIMDLQVTKQMNHEQSERYWLSVIQNLPPEKVAMALALKLPEYVIPSQRRRP
ncbi:hypothetical protein Q427_18080 [Halomonas sp. BC04]|nr:hypothetical protein Q427_18080 [Halomonas sp. BC04]